jgi:Ca2+-binding EF-hand superfamily protein
MARHFREQDIDEFRDCFYLNTCSSGQISDVKELCTIMRSLGMSPTASEMQSYLSGKGLFIFCNLQTGNAIIINNMIVEIISGGKLSFADFLDVMHTHSKKEKIPTELLDAFSAWPNNRNGSIPASDLKHILSEWGEKLDEKEMAKLFREVNISFNSYINFQDFVRIITAPAPDY